jgi:hypothetical protein
MCNIKCLWKWKQGQDELKTQQNMLARSIKKSMEKLLMSLGRKRCEIDIEWIDIFRQRII